jgi:hypothetical protein
MLDPITSTFQSLDINGVIKDTLRRVQGCGTCSRSRPQTQNQIDTILHVDNQFCSISKKKRNGLFILLMSLAN